MTFEQTVWLYWTPAILLLFGAMVTYGFRRRDALLGRFAAARLLDQLTEKASTSRSWLKASCILIAVAAIGIALARPQLGVEWSERKARGLDIVFVLDSSKSMLATDLRPTRLERAKLAVIDLVERLESDRIGLVAFAGQAFLQTPPTLDYSAFRESLDAVDPGIMTSGGSDLGNALKEAAEAFPSDNNVKVVVLLTDGEDLSGKAAEAAEAAREAGIQVFSIGIGTPEGEYLRIRNAEGIEEFVRDSSGQPVRSQLDETTLQQIAQATGGSYSRLSGDTLDQLYSSVLATLPREERESELQEIRTERFQWALSAAAIFLVLEILIRRRRNAAIHAALFVIAALAFHPNEAQAQANALGDAVDSGLAEAPQSTDARSSYNAAYEALSAGEFDTAVQLYESALAQTTDLQLQSDALYNMGHAAYQQGRATYEAGDPQAALEQIKKAESLFKSAQQIKPTDSAINQDIEQTTKVREAIEKLIEQQQEQPQEQSDQSEESEDSQQEGDQSEDNQDGSEQGEPSEQQEGEQGENSEEQEGDPSQQDQEGQQSENQDGAEGDPSEGSDESQQENAEGDPSQGAPQESTQDPVDDIPEQTAGDEDESAEEQEGQQSSGAPEPTEGEEFEGQEGNTAMLGEPIEGMTEADAAALLDTLRSKETLLPFIDQKNSGRQRDVRDW